MGTDSAKFFFYVAAFCALTPFVVMYAAWIALRLRKLSVARWKGYQRIWLRIGVILLLAGGSIYAFAPPEAHPSAFVAILGGALNALVAVFQARIVEILTRKPPGGTK